MLNKKLLLIFFLFSFYSTFGQDKVLTLDDLYGQGKAINFNGIIPKINWKSDGLNYLQTDIDSKIKIVKVLTSEETKFYDPIKMQKALILVGISESDAIGLTKLDQSTFSLDQKIVLLNYNKDLYCYFFDADKAIRLTNTPEIKEQEEDFSPNNLFVSFVSQNNLHVISLSNKKTTQITQDGNKNLLNGILDWVYEEELYGRGNKRGYWWAPNSSAIVFLQLDQSKVPDFIIPDDVPPSQVLESTKYPKAGDPNPFARLGVINISDKLNSSEISWIDNSKYSEFLITKVGWNKENKIIFTIQNREQTWLEFNIFDKSTGITKLLLREESKAWIDTIELPLWLADQSFLIQSDRTGWRHIYHYSPDGKLIKPMTEGSWDVREVYGVSSDGWIYFSATKRTFIGNDIYRIKLDGSSLECLSKDLGTHVVKFNPQLTFYIDVFSNVTTPKQTRLHKSDGSLVRVIEENLFPDFKKYKFGKIEFLQVPTRDGFSMEAMKIVPPNFDANKKYPVLVHIYGGPGIQKVLNVWNSRDYFWHQMLAQQGYIIWICDNRSASGKGIQSAHTIYKNFGELELKDLEDSVKFLTKDSYIDTSRIGIWGWSYGGYISSYALTHSNTFKIGIAGAPVTDWRNYDSIYTERYMGLPKNNPVGYSQSSVIEATNKLQGKLLLIHGLSDDNVHVQHSIQFIDAMQRAGKQFDLMLYPQSRHGITLAQRKQHLYTVMTRFIIANL